MRCNVAIKGLHARYDPHDHAWLEDILRCAVSKTPADTDSDGDGTRGLLL